MDTFIFNNQRDLLIGEKSVQAIAEEVVHFEGVQFDEAAIHFVDESTICALHGRYFNDPSPTDCISFPMDGVNEEGYKVLGEVFVCPKTALKYVEEHTERTAYEEITLYIIHGLLHLMGYDDMNSSDRVKMKKAEERHMENLRNKDLLLRPPKV